ncbi:MAG TPA: YhbD family protein [Candidatus Aquicultor sp.]|jgi:hypothetical protein
MEQDLISKKELLELAGISYGQLYRWKRKKLIPEDWFIRKATFTGQETFFPHDRILARVDKIKNMKEDLSLDDLADIFSPNLAEIILQKEELVSSGIVSRMILDVFVEQHGSLDVFSFEDILYAYVLEKVLQTGDISTDEGKIILRALEDNYRTFEGRTCELVFVRKLGIATCCLISSPCEIYFEIGARLVTRVNIAAAIEELKIKLT